MQFNGSLKMQCDIVIYKQHPDAVLPTYAYNGTSAAFDLICVEDTVIKAKSSAIVPNGLRFTIPQGSNFFMTLNNRSSLGFKKDLIVYSGIIDEGYTGDMGVKFYNLGNEDVLIKKGDKYSQVLIYPKIDITFKVVNEDQYIEFEKTQIRGNKGFGSSN